MSRIAKKPFVIPAGVEITMNAGSINVKGPRGTLTRVVHPHVHCVQTGNEIAVTVEDPNTEEDRALWGTFGSHVRNMIRGVTDGYTKQLEVNGIGYRAQVSGQKLVLNVGYTHPIEYSIPAGITITVDKSIITVNGANKETVGSAAAYIRSVKPPEPYQGKGIKYSNEVIRRKAGKAAKTGAAAAA
ncbi:50S ribosomal protein L6 [Candidatus Uhrbacteria bacterium]|nr:50S ribosomal protein L6 [Candidatus Uhrbacteria bacterium]